MYLVKKGLWNQTVENTFIRRLLELKDSNIFIIWLWILLALLISISHKQEREAAMLLLVVVIMKGQVTRNRQVGI